MKQLAEKATSSSRWHYLDLMKCIGILFVLIYHATTYSYSWMHDGDTTLLIRYFLRTILSTCVPLFFFVNGYLLLNKPLNLKAHITKTLKMVLITLIWAMLTLVILMPIENAFLSWEQFLQYAKSLDRDWLNYLWYMGALTCIYIFFPLLKATFDHNKKAFIYFTIICALLTFGNSLIADLLSVLLHKGLGRPNLFNMFNPFKGIYGYAFVYFCIGGLTHTIKEKLTNRGTFVPLLTITLSCCGLFIMGISLSTYQQSVWDVVWYGYDSVFTLINVMMIFILCLSYKGQYRWIRSISTNTLGIYFVHKLLIHITSRYIYIENPYIFNVYFLRHLCSYYSHLVSSHCTRHA